MTDDLFRPPFGGADDHDGGEAERSGLPGHEIDDDTAVGGGLMGSGGTATDRGTGELTGRAQGDADTTDDVEEDAGVNEGAIAGPPAGGAQTYVPGFIDDDDQGGGALPDA
jgi:hypothetical protein